MGNVSVPETFRDHDGLRESWTEYRKPFGEMKSTFRNVFATEATCSLPRKGRRSSGTTEGTSNGDTVSYDGVSILEIVDGKVRRFMAYFDTRDLTPQVVD